MTTLNLKKLRVGLVSIVFIISLGVLITGANKLQFITKLQLIPAAVSFSLIILIGL